MGIRKAEHEGDLWHNTSDNTQWIYKSGIWQPQSIPNELLDKIDGKSSVYMVQPKPPYYEGDLWVTTNSEGKASLKTSFVNRINGDFTASDWIDFKYADKDDIKMQLIITIPVLDRMKCLISLQKAERNRESIFKMEKYISMQNTF